MQAAPQRAPPPPPLLECKASGTLEDVRVPALMHLLRALDPRPPVAVLEQEVVLRGQSADGKGPGPELRLLRDLSAGESSTRSGWPATDAADGGSTWRVRHEGAALRGKGMAELPASVRAVAEAGCAGQAPLAFWAALGFAERFGFAREGHRYALEYDGHALQARHTLCWACAGTGSQVTVARVRRCTASGLPSEEVAPGQWLLEVVARAAEGAHPAAARAIGSFGAMLEPPVELEKT